MASHGDGGVCMLAFTKQLLNWDSTEELTERLTRKPPLNGVHGGVIGV
jgi:hypothetical protein